MGWVGTRRAEASVILALIAALTAPAPARAGADAAETLPGDAFKVNVAGLVHVGADCFDVAESADRHHCAASDFDFPQIAVGLRFHFRMADRHGRRYWFRKSDIVIKGGDPKVAPPKKPEMGGSASRS
jgi:hypothetical protein